MQSFVVTGTSSGIGQAFARLATARGAKVFGSVRTQADADRLAGELGPNYIPLIFDVRDADAVGRAAQSVRGALSGQRLSGLVNNAGMAIPAPLLFQPLDEIRAQIETDLLSLFIVSKAFLPLLGADPALTGDPGRIVNMSSIGGKLRQPFATAYIASKHGIEGFTGALRRELQVFGIHVAAIGPGVVDTPIWDKVASQRGRYDGTPYEEPFNKGVDVMVEAGKKHGLKSEALAEVIWKALTDPHPRLRYAPASHPILEQGVLMAMPQRVIDWSLARFIGFKRKVR